VQVDYGGAGGLLAGTRGEPIHQPSYITLGHELGHARRSLAGRGRSGPVWDRPTDPAHADARRQAVERNLWRDSPEEFENITTEENPLRQELGLPERRYHRAHEAVVGTLRRQALVERYQRAYDRLGRRAEDLPGHDVASDWVNGYPRGEVDWQAAGAHERAEARVAAFERQVAEAHRGQQGGGWRRAVGWGLGGLALAGAAALYHWGGRR
jgi:hypothetical protein